MVKAVAGLVPTLEEGETGPWVGIGVGTLVALDGDGVAVGFTGVPCGDGVGPMLAAVGDGDMVSWIVGTDARAPSCFGVSPKQPARTIGTAKSAQRVSPLMLNLRWVAIHAARFKDG